MAEMGMIHDVYDTDTRFLINAINRTVRNESNKKTVLIQKDHNSERFSFEVDRFIEGHDMSLCNVVEVHYINMGANEKEVSRGLYRVTDLQVHSEDENKLVFSWLISEQATQFVGQLAFLITFKCEQNGEVVYRWNTARNKDIAISEGLDNSGYVAEVFADLLAQWEREIIALRREVAESSSPSYSPDDALKCAVDTDLVNPCGNSGYVFTDDAGTIFVI